MHKPGMTLFASLVLIFTFAFVSIQPGLAHHGQTWEPDSPAVSATQASRLIAPEIPLRAASGFVTVNRGASYDLLGGRWRSSVTPDQVLFTFIKDSGNPGNEIPGLERYSSTEKQMEAIRLQFTQASPQAWIRPAERQKGVFNLLQGQNPQQWVKEAPIYASLEVEDLYPGITLRLGQVKDGLKSTFLVSPGSYPEEIRWQYAGAGEVRLNPSGECEIYNQAGELLLTDRAPKAWQVRLGRQVPVPVRFSLGENHQVGFILGRYDPALPLVIDPVIQFSSYLGGSGDDTANAVAVDASGSVYIAGTTQSSDFPSKGTPPYGVDGGAVFVTKFSSAGELVYSTVLGGTYWDEAWAISVDDTGNAYVSGFTGSTNFPLKDPTQPTHGGDLDAFVLKLNPAGSDLLFSTYHGGPGDEYVYQQALTTDGTLVVIGEQEKGDFPVTAGVYDPSYNGKADGFIFAIDTVQTTVRYSGYLGGSDTDILFDVVLNTQDEPIVIGYTRSLDLPVLDAYQPVNHGGNCWYGACYESFISHFTADGAALLYSTYLGGSGSDYARSLALDTDGNIVAFGMTDSLDFPTVNAIQPVNMQGGYFGDFFITKFNNARDGLVFSTFIGGIAQEFGTAIEIDDQGRIFFSGTSDWACIPLLSYLPRDNQDALLVVLEPGAKAIAYHQYLSGSNSEAGNALALSPDRSVWIVGATSSSDFTLANAFDSSLGGQKDAFLSQVTHQFPHPEYMLYLPSAKKGNQPGIYGQVWKWECGLKDIKLELRYYDGSRWSTQAVAYTADDGTFNFPDIPSLLPGEKYYVRYVNESGSGTTMAFYATREITQYQQGMPLLIDRFWLDEFGPGIPSDGEIVPPPVTFMWTPNQVHSSDSYELILNSKQDTSLVFSTGPLGFVNEYVLQSLPSGFQAGKEYFWFNAVYTAGGGYGESYDEHSIRFTNSLFAEYLPGGSLFRPVIASRQAADRFEALYR